jgi:hypothetical protein
MWQVQQANKIIAFTGAGISTAAGIPDFRGPQGVWTLQRKGLPLPKLQTSFVYAKPSLTHQALLGLLQSGKLQYICSQNVDSLHLRSGQWAVFHDASLVHGNPDSAHLSQLPVPAGRSVPATPPAEKLTWDASATSTHTAQHQLQPGCRQGVWRAQLGMPNTHHCQPLLFIPWNCSMTVPVNMLHLTVGVPVSSSLPCC